MRVYLGLRSPQGSAGVVSRNARAGVWRGNQLKAGARTSHLLRLSRRRPPARRTDTWLARQGIVLGSARSALVQEASSSRRGYGYSAPASTSELRLLRAGTDASSAFERNVGVSGLASVHLHNSASTFVHVLFRSRLLSLELVPRLQGLRCVVMLHDCRGRWVILVHMSLNSTLAPNETEHTPHCTAVSQVM
jgi:hypothetical protein